MAETSSSWLLQLEDNILLHLFGCLTVPDIQVVRQTCHRMWRLSHQPTVWLNAYRAHVLKGNIMSHRMDRCLKSLSPVELAMFTIGEYRYVQNVISNPGLRHVGKVVHPGPVEHMKLLESGGKLWLITHDGSKNLYVWNCTTFEVVHNWTPQDSNTRMPKVTFHTEWWSDPVIAAYTFPLGSPQTTHLLTLTHSGRLEVLNSQRDCCWDKFLGVHDDKVALRSRNDSWVKIRNRETQEQCELRYPGPDKVSARVEKVYFLPGMVVVVQERSASVYAPPSLKPSQDEMLVHKPRSHLYIPYPFGYSYYEPLRHSLSWCHDDVLPSLLLHYDKGFMLVRIIKPVPQLCAQLLRIISRPVLKTCSRLLRVINGPVLETYSRQLKIISGPFLKRSSRLLKIISRPVLTTCSWLLRVINGPVLETYSRRLKIISVPVLERSSRLLKIISRPVLKTCSWLVEVIDRPVLKADSPIPMLPPDEGSMYHEICLGDNGMFVEIFCRGYADMDGLLDGYTLRVVALPGGLNASDKVQIKGSCEVASSLKKMDYNDDFRMVAGVGDGGIIELFRLFV